MKKTFYLMLLTLMPTLLYGQTVTNVEDFPIGTVLKFQNCLATGVTPGNAGTNQIWNFSSLSTLPDTTTEWMVLPATTPFASMYPAANLVEKYSDGSYVYVDKKPQGNYLLGFKDLANNVAVNYPNSLLFAQRPLTFGGTTTDTFTTSFTASGFNFRGKGTSVIQADGYGSLILPNGVFNNVLRVKTTMTQTDTLIQFGTVSQSTTVIYTWFDGIHKSALLKMDATTSGGFSQQTVAYLLSETSGPTGLKKPDSTLELKIYPNPAKTYFTFESKNPGLLSITNSLGQTVSEISITDQKTDILTNKLAPGIYILNFRAGNFSYTKKLILN